MVDEFTVGILGTIEKPYVVKKQYIGARVNCPRERYTSLRAVIRSRCKVKHT
jgi:hypothetical protein